MKEIVAKRLARQTLSALPSVKMLHIQARSKAKTTSGAKQIG